MCMRPIMVWCAVLAGAAAGLGCTRRASTRSGSDRMPPPAEAREDVHGQAAPTTSAETQAVTAVIRTLLDFDIDDRGHIGFNGSVEHKGWGFFLVTQEGEILAEIPIGEQIARESGVARLRWVKGDRWVTAGDTLPVRAGWIDAGRLTVESIKGLHCDGIMAIASDHRGGFLIYAPAYKESRGHGLSRGCIISVDAAGKQHLLVGESEDSHHTPPNASIAVTDDREIVVLDQLDQNLIVFSARGEYRRTLTSGQPRWSYPAGQQISPDLDGGVVWMCPNNSWKLRRIPVRDFTPPTSQPAEPEPYPRLEVSQRYPDGRAIGPDGVHVAPDGRLWVSDGKAIMRLTDEGVVDRVLGGGSGDQEPR